MSHDDRPSPDPTLRSPEDLPPPGPVQMDGPAEVYDRPDRMSGRSSLMVGVVALVVLALLVFLMVQFVF